MIENAVFIQKTKEDKAPDNEERGVIRCRIILKI